MMSTVLLETCREVKHIKKCIKLVINMNCTEMHGQQNITYLLTYLLTYSMGQSPS